VRRPLILLLLIAALAPTSAMASEWIRCRIDGEARKTCCCPPDEREEDPSRPAEIAATGCCDVDKLAGQSADPRAMPDIAAIAIAPPVRTVVRLAPPEIAVVDLAPAMEAAQPRGPPSLFALGCSLLV
jgi:hypothetical protein